MFGPGTVVLNMETEEYSSYQPSISQGDNAMPDLKLVSVNDVIEEQFVFIEMGIVGGGERCRYRVPRKALHVLFDLPILVGGEFVGVNVAAGP